MSFVVQPWRELRLIWILFLEKRWHSSPVAELHRYLKYLQQQQQLRPTRRNLPRKTTRSLIMPSIAMASKFELYRVFKCLQCSCETALQYAACAIIIQMKLLLIVVERYAMETVTLEVDRIALLVTSFHGQTNEFVALH